MEKDHAVSAIEKTEKAETTPTTSDVDVAPESFPAINEKKLLRKLDGKLLPVLTILYLLSFLDRSNGEDH